VKRKGVEAGITGFVQTLESIVSLAKALIRVFVMDSYQSGWLLQISKCPDSPPTPVVPPSTHGVNHSSRRSVRETLPKEGKGGGGTSVETVTGQKAGTFVASTKYFGDDAR
jgi:hypothetical protein